MFFAIEGHDLQQQGVQTGVDVPLLLSQVAESARLCAVLFDHLTDGGDQICFDPTVRVM